MALAVLSLLANLGIWLHPAAAQPHDPARAEARARFERGLARFSAYDYAGALAEFERAQALSPNPVVLFNIGLVYAALDRPVQAAEALEQVLQTPGQLSSEHLARARALRDELASRVAHVTLTTNVPALIQVDGIDAGRTPLSKPLGLVGGTHIIAAQAPGYIAARRELTVAGGTQSELAIALIPAQPRSPQVATACPQPDAICTAGPKLERPLVAAPHAVAPQAQVTRTAETPPRRVAPKRRWGRGLTAGGAPLVVVGAALGIWSQATLPDLERALARTKQDFTRGSGTDCDTAKELRPAVEAQCQGRIDDAFFRLQRRERLRAIGFASTALGVSLAAVGALLLTTHAHPAKHDRLALSTVVSRHGTWAGAAFSF